MNVSLKIEDDKELRVYLRELLKGQVRSISRDELKELVKEALGKAGVDTHVQTIYKSVIHQFVKEEFRQIGAKKIVLEVCKEVIQGVIGEIAVERDWSKLIDDAATYKLKKLIDEQSNIAST